LIFLIFGIAPLIYSTPYSRVHIFAPRTMDSTNIKSPKSQGLGLFHLSSLLTQGFKNAKKYKEPSVAIASKD